MKKEVNILKKNLKQINKTLELMDKKGVKVSIKVNDSVCDNRIGFNKSKYKSQSISATLSIEVK